MVELENTMVRPESALVTCDDMGLIKQYDYGWFVGCGGNRPNDSIGYVDVSPSYGLVTRKTFSAERAAVATNEIEVARMALEGMPEYGMLSDLRLSLRQHHAAGV